MVSEPANNMRRDDSTEHDTSNDPEPTTSLRKGFRAFGKVGSFDPPPNGSMKTRATGAAPHEGSHSDGGMTRFRLGPFLEDSSPIDGRSCHRIEQPSPLRGALGTHQPVCGGLAYCDVVSGTVPNRRGRRSVNGSNRLPTGTVTFLFTDIEGSTQLLHRLGDAFIDLNDRHLAIVRTAILDVGGTIVRTEGDGFFAAFPSAPAAVEAAAAGQRALAEQSWPEDVSVAVRMGLHTGAGLLGGDDYVGMDVVRAARIADAGHGGQILVSESTAALIGKDLPKGTVLRDLGSYELKDLAAPELIAELLIDSLAQEFPPLRTRSLQGSLPDRLSSFIGREALVAQSLRLLAQTRLLTLVGPGGTGKTRLAIRVAKEAESGFADGSFFVELATVSDPGVAPSAVLHTPRHPRS